MMTEVSTSFSEEWNAGLHANNLRLPACDSCGGWNWYPLPFCRSCGSNKFTWISVSHQGTVHSFTRVQRPFSAGHDVPYLVALVEPSDAAGVRIPCKATGAIDSVDVGERVELRAELDAGKPHWGFLRT